MSDRERFLAFLHGAGFTEDKDDERRGPPRSGYMLYDVDDEGRISVGNNGDENRYCCFYSSWAFDAAGKFVGVGHFE